MIGEVVEELDKSISQPQPTCAHDWGATEAAAPLLYSHWWFVCFLARASFFSSLVLGGGIGLVGLGPAFWPEIRSEGE